MEQTTKAVIEEIRLLPFEETLSRDQALRDGKVSDYLKGFS